MLALDVNETQAVVTVDGRGRGVYAAPLRLPAGPHHLRVDRGDFEPFDRDFSVDADATVTVHVALEPTPDFRARYVSHAQAARTWAIVSLAAGAVVLGSGIGLVVYDAKQRGDGNAMYSGLQAGHFQGSGLACDTGQAFDAFQMLCAVPESKAQSQVNDANTRDYFGWGAVALGGAAVGLGVILLATGDDPHRFDRAVAGASRRSPLRAMPVFWTARGGGGIALSGAF